jgi:syntaxin 16
MDDEYFQTALKENNLGPKYKNEEINGLVKSINDLAVIFKDISVLVVEQGTILDRIDYNIYEAKDNMVEANKHL